MSQEILRLSTHAIDTIFFLWNTVPTGGVRSNMLKGFQMGDCTYRFSRSCPTQPPTVAGPQLKR